MTTPKSLPGCKLVSVVTAVRNGAETVSATIHSVALQTARLGQHIVVDDGSEDATAKLVLKLADQYPHLVYLHQSAQGAGAARNRGIARASYRFIAFLDCGDLWWPQKLERQIAFMLDTDAAFTYGDYEKRRAGTQQFIARYKTPDALSYHDLLRGCPIGCLTVAFDQFALGKRFMPDYARGQDWALWLDLTRDGLRARKYPGSLAIYYDEPASLSSAKINKAMDIFRIYRVEERIGFLSTLIYMAQHVARAVFKR